MKDVTGVLADTPKIADHVNVIWGMIVAFFSYLFGEHWFLFAGFLALNVIDIITGTYKAHVANGVSSEAGFRGVMKKVWYWTVIAIAFFIASSFVEMGEVIGIKLDFVILFGWLTLAMYLVNEIRSVLENLVEVGVEVPDFMVKGLDITKKLMDAKTKGGQDNG